MQEKSAGNKGHDEATQADGTRWGKESTEGLRGEDQQGKLCPMSMPYAEKGSSPTRAPGCVGSPDGRAQT